jgi:short-subunit dehydrogenase
VLSARRAAELERVRRRCPAPDDVAVLPLDLERFDAAEAAARAAAAFGPIDVLVNNAGLSQRSLVVETDLAVYRRLMELDFFAPVALTKAVLPAMLARRGGHVVAVSSVAGQVATPLRSGYAAAKHALHGFYDALRAEVHDQGIAVTVVMPGFIRTDVSVNALTAHGAPQGTMDAAQAKGMDPLACAERIWRAVAANRSDASMGGVETWILLLKRLSPRLVERLMRRARVT